MAKDKSVTVTQIRVEQDHAELKVMAQGALLGERVVAMARLGMFLLIGVSTGVVGRLTGTLSPPSTLRDRKSVV